MDKILFSTLIGLFAAFLTAVLGFTKLINDKEGKTSEFRQEWTNSIRKTLADLVSSFRNLIELYEKSFKKGQLCGNLNKELAILSGDLVNDKEYDARKEFLIFNKNILEQLNREILETKKNIYEDLSMALLHFKPNDYEFLHVENKFDLMVEIISDIEELQSSFSEEDGCKYIRARKYEIELHCKDILSISRSLLKKEWEKIKSGEDNYIKTKKVFKYGSVLMTAAIVIIFLFLTVSRFSNYLADEKIKIIHDFYKKGELIKVKNDAHEINNENEKLGRAPLEK